MMYANHHVIVSGLVFRGLQDCYGFSAVGPYRNDRSKAAKGFRLWAVDSPEGR